MACEKPVISTNLEGVKNSVGNRIFYCYSSDDYYSTIMKLKKEGPLMDSLQDNRKYVEEHFEWRSVGISVERILMDAI
jgi:glycosyltransferase involved in cell wall biosynthesis